MRAAPGKTRLPGPSFQTQVPQNQQVHSCQARHFLQSGPCCGILCSPPIGTLGNETGLPKANPWGNPGISAWLDSSAKDRRVNGVPLWSSWSWVQPRGVTPPGFSSVLARTWGSQRRFTCWYQSCAWPTALQDPWAAPCTILSLQRMKLPNAAAVWTSSCYSSAVFIQISKQRGLLDCYHVLVHHKQPGWGTGLLKVWKLHEVLGSNWWHSATHSKYTCTNMLADSSSPAPHPKMGARG